MEETWHLVGTNATEPPGCLGEGTEAQPLIVLGDASGGKDSGDPRFMRVGIATTVLEAFSPCVIRASVQCPLAGRVQSVPRGE
eukprot:1671459-Pyramimonas_sp.AAC.1